MKLTNSDDPDQTPHVLSSDQGRHGLLTLCSINNNGSGLVQFRSFHKKYMGDKVRVVC